MAEQQQLPEQQQFPEWIEKYRAAIQQTHQETPSGLDWQWIGSLLIALLFTGGLAHMLWITYAGGR